MFIWVSYGLILILFIIHWHMANKVISPVFSNDKLLIAFWLKV